MGSRERILARLRAAPRPFGVVPPPPFTYVPVTADAPESHAARVERFVQEATALSAIVHRPAGDGMAVALVREILGSDRTLMAWEEAHLPLPTLLATLLAEGRTLADPRDGGVRVGVTGADAALAATGTLVISSGPGRARAASLLPPVHVALVRESQIAADLESWLNEERAQGRRPFQEAANVVLISGPSRTADIAMELILGMHGPATLHVILLPAP